MEITEEKRRDILILHVKGKIDASTAERLERGLLQPIEQGNIRLVVDMSGVDYISSIGLRIFLMAAKKLRASGGGIALAALQEPIRKVFTMAAFDKILPLLNGVESAIEAVS